MTICARGTCSKKETRSEKNRSEETHICEATDPAGPMGFGVGAARGAGVFHLGDAGRQRLCVY